VFAVINNPAATYSYAVAGGGTGGAAGSGSGGAVGGNGAAGVIIVKENYPASPSPAGALVNLQNLTASASASLVFTLPTGYRRYKLFLEGFITSVATTLQLQISEDGGATWKTAANYVNAFIYSQGGGAATGASSATTSIQPFLGYDLTVSPVSSSEILISSPASAGKYTCFQFQSGMVGGGLQCTTTGMAYWNGDTGAINAIRLIPAAGNITSGTASLYGIV